MREHAATRMSYILRDRREALEYLRAELDRASRLILSLPDEIRDAEADIAELEALGIPEMVPVQAA